VGFSGAFAERDLEKALVDNIEKFLSASRSRMYLLLDSQEALKARLVQLSAAYDEAHDVGDDRGWRFLPPCP